MKLQNTEIKEDKRFKMIVRFISYNEERFKNQSPTTIFLQGKKRIK